jgi:hypothetical protein
MKSDIDDNLVRDVLTITLVSVQNEGEDLDKWTGTWLGKGSVYTISVDKGNGTLYGSYNYNLPGVYWGNAKGNGTFSNGEIKSGKLSCDWSGSHEDDDKTYEMTGKMFFTLYGKTLHVQGWITIETKVNWKEGRPRYDVTELGKGGGFQGDLERPKN